MAISPNDDGIAHINKITLHLAQLVVRGWSFVATGIPSWCVNSHPSQLSFLPSLGWEMSTGQSVMMLSSWEANAVVTHSTGG